MSECRACAAGWVVPPRGGQVAKQERSEVGGREECQRIVVRVIVHLISYAPSSRRRSRGVAPITAHIPPASLLVAAGSIVAESTLAAEDTLTAACVANMVVMDTGSEDSWECPAASQRIQQRVVRLRQPPRWQP